MKLDRETNFSGPLCFRYYVLPFSPNRYWIDGLMPWLEYIARLFGWCVTRYLGETFFAATPKLFLVGLGDFVFFITLNDSPFSQPFFICGNVGCVPCCDKRATTGRWGGSASSHTCTYINKRVRVNICGTPSKAATAIVHTPHSFGCSWHREYMTRGKEIYQAQPSPKTAVPNRTRGKTNSRLLSNVFHFFFLLFKIFY